MGFRQSFQVLAVGSLLLSVVSCGSDSNKSSPEPSISTLCSEISCLSTVNWKIQLQGRSFPDKARVDVDGVTVLNECISKQKYSIDRYSEPQSLMLENYTVPAQGKVKVQITDLGADCRSSSTFLEDNNVQYEVIKSESAVELLLNL